jgi:flagellar assembly protein FliH
MPPLKLEDFHSDSLLEDGVVVSTQQELEEAKIASYEQGYAAGWDDSIVAQGEDQNRIRADLARNLQTISFTFHEARSHVMRSVGPLLEAVATHLLPRLAREALAPVILDALMPIADEHANQPLTIVINPAARPALDSLLERTPSLPCKLREEPSLGEGQVYLVCGDTELRIDLDRATDEIIAALRGFLELNALERKHG